MLIIFDSELMEYNAQLQVCMQDFRQLLKQNTIPSKMLIKLQYLESAILDLKREEALIGQLPQFERLSLIQMNRETQISLFVNIVKCFSGKQVIQYFTNQKSTLRKEQTFSGWTSCYLSCDSNRLTATKKSDAKEFWHEFYIDKLWISKIYRQHKKRYFFGIAYDKQKYMVGFEQEGTCARIHGVIINLIRQRRGVRDKLKEIRMSETNLSEGTNQLQFQRENGVLQNEFDEQEYIEFEEREYLSQIQDRLMRLELFDNSDYELVKNIDNGRILENKGENSFKICLLLDKLTIETILEKFVEFTQWNTHIESFKVLNRIRSNTFLAHLKLKKFNMLTYPRETHLTITYIKTCPCLTPSDQKYQNQPQYGKHYLLLKTLENESPSINLGAVQMNLEQVIQFSGVQDNPSTIFMVMWSKVDFKGYDYFNYNREMNLLLLNDFSFFSSYSKQKSSSDKKFIFDANYCACKLKKHRKNSCQSEPSLASNIEYQQKQKKPVMPIAQMKATDVAAVVQSYHKNIRNESIIEVIRKNYFQNYSLKHQFTEAINSQFKESKYTYRQVKDFLLQNGRWKISPSNSNLIFCNQEAIKAQKGVLKMVLKQIGSNLMSGKSIMNMSLPVEIFDNFSMLEVIANMMGFFPRFINDAVNSTSLIEQIKYVTMSYMFVSSCFPNAQKPFNPILGETFQGSLGGIPIYLEQTFHHPPTSTIYMKTDDFQTYGNFDTHVQLGLNSAYSKVSYYFTVKIFKTKTQYIIRLGDVEMGGVSFGERMFRMTGRGFVYEKVNDLYCQFAVGKDRKKVYEYSGKLKSNDLAGGVFKVTNSFGKRLLSMDRSKPYQGVKFDDIIQKYCQISGKWYGDIYFDNVAYKTIEEGPFPVRVERPNYLLPSDCLFRTDIIYKNWNQCGKSNEEKEILQNLQRKDKKLRQRYQQK